MDAMRGVAEPIYEDFVPSSELVPEEDCDTLLLYLLGFKKEDLRVQLTRRILRISGSQLIDHNKWKRFQKEFPVSANCDTRHISAKFEGGILYVKQPKRITPTHKQDEHHHLPAFTAPESHNKPADESSSHKNFLEPGATDESRSHKNFQELDAKRIEGLPAHTGGNYVPEKAPEKAEESTTRKIIGSVKNEKEKKTADSINAVETKNKATAENENGNGKTSLTSSQDIAGGMESRQNMQRRAIHVALAVLLALLLGLYVGGWISSFKKAGIEADTFAA